MEVIGSIYTEVSERFQKGIISGGILRCVKAEKNDLGVVMAEIQEKRLGNIYSFDGGNYAGNVYDKECISPTLRTMQGGNSQPMVVAMRGRNPDNPSDRTTGSPTEQRLEVNTQGTSNCLTSVQKDDMVLENSQYRIRKLTPRECGRLMGVFDEDIDRMAEVNSNTQLYKQFGNSIVVDVMCAMFKNLNIDQGGDLVLKSGDTIKCSDAEDMIKTMNELEQQDIQTDFLYEKDGEKGYWLEIL